MEELELYKGLKSIALKQLEELHRKGSMSPAEAEAAKTAMCIIEKAKEAIEKDEMGSDEYSRRSYAQPYRHYTIDSYADGRFMRGGSYGMYPMYDDYAMESPRGGSYRGDSYRGDSYANQSRDRNGRYSSHSIDDRVVDMLEKMVDSAKSDFEHQKLMEYIRYVRSREMSE